MKDKFFLVTIISIFLSACTQVKEDISEAKIFLNNHEYQNAIDILSKHKSKKTKSMLSNAYLDYGVFILRNEDIKEVERYSQAKEKFKLAYEINPKNNSASDLYNMVDKLELVK